VIETADLILEHKKVLLAGAFLFAAFADHFIEGIVEHTQ
jgi:hypothetical protein